MKRGVTQIFIVCFLIVTLIDTFPASGKFINSLRDKIDPLVDVLGIWQGTWDLFAPNVDKENHRIEVRYFLQGRTNPDVSLSPDWESLSCLGRFQHSRHIEFYDRIRNSSNSAVWSSYSRFLKEEYERRFTNAKIGRIELTVLSSEIPGVNEFAASVEVSRIPFYEVDFNE